jgi:radical SAM-linked protein
MRIRVAFSKTEAMRFTGHLDLHRTWERTFRRARMPIAYSQGFHPQPRLNLACALPLGITSQCELLDAWLETPLSTAEIHQALVKAVPPGIKINRIEEITQPLPALQTQVTATVYEITLLDAVMDLAQRINQINTSSTLPRIRRGKPYDLLPLIEELILLTPDESGLQRFAVRLATREAATGRPEEVLAVLGIPLEATRIHRTAIILQTA